MLNTEQKEILETVMQQVGHSIPEGDQPAVRQVIENLLESNQSLKMAMGMSDGMMEILYNHAYKLYQTGHFKQALKMFAFLRKLEPGDTRYCLGIAACHHRMKEYNSAAVNYLIWSQMEPLNPIPYFHLYDCHLCLSQPIPALDALEKVIILTKDNPKFKEMHTRALLEKPGLIENLRGYIKENYDSLPKLEK